MKKRSYALFWAFSFLICCMGFIIAQANEPSYPKFYYGKVNSIKFNKDGTFFFRLKIASKRSESGSSSKCDSSTNFFVKENYPYINSTVLKRMHDDVREAFFSTNNPKISVFVYGCDEEIGYLRVGNIMLGEWKDVDLH